jgi:threonine aldolase
MRRAMADAELGDDVYGEDQPLTSYKSGQQRCLGRSRTLWLVTMGNLVSLQRMHRGVLRSSLAMDAYLQL